MKGERAGGNPYAHCGRFGSPTTRAFEPAVARLEGGYRAQVFPSGPAAGRGGRLFRSRGRRSIAADAVGSRVVFDNSRASPLYLKPFALGVDSSVQAATKYLVGHSDALLGVATANEETWPLLAAGAHDFGETTGSRYLSRVARHLQLAQTLERHPAVLRVLHPALPAHPPHPLWECDFSGASGLFGLLLGSEDKTQISAFFRSLQLFGIGLSWARLREPRSAKTCPAPCTSSNRREPLLAGHGLNTNIFAL